MTKRYRAGDGFSVQTLMHAANDHLVAARVLFESSRSQVLDSAGYLAHLGIELALKAGLLHVAGSFPNEHNLGNLAAELRGHIPSFEVAPPYHETFELVSEFTELRYPGLEMAEVGSLHGDDVEALFGHLLDKLPPDLRRAVQQIDHTNKGGRILLERRDPRLRDGRP
jgi:HEPN domain-containing protein